MSQDPATGPWHLDKRVPVALILALLVQTGAAFVWAGRIDERVSALEAWRADTKGLAADIAVMKNEIININKSMGRIEDAIVERDRRGP